VKLDRKLLVLAAAASICACNGTTSGSSAGNMVVTSDVASLNNDGSLAHITVTVVDGQGHPATGSVTVSASGGNLDGSGTSSVNKTLDAAGKTTLTYACDFTLDTTHCGAGNITVTAVWSSVANGTRVTLIGPSAPPPSDGGSPPPPVDAGPIVGGPAGPAAAVSESAMFPDVLGIQGSGIQEYGVMSFLVTDSAGRPVANAAVNFSQRQPNLVTLGRTLGVTGNDGKVIVDYTSGPNVGISAIIATVPATGATGSHPIAVRGAKPSASGFYFRCNQTNLPVYTTTPQYETVTCTVRLSDRYGNRVGIATPVNFAAEAGSISASATTKAFDFNNPTDPDEGSVTVTFSSDMGIGFAPVETTPFAADPTQFPKPRGAEPFNGSLNPRDQLVTIIAMVAGEEAFVDANLDGQYNAGELFVDQGDPFIDANDNNTYDAATEPRFCGGSSCSTYHGPNGVWDANTVIWAPTWVVFTAAPFPQATPFVPTNCIDYLDNNGPNPFSATTTVGFLDRWLNVGPAGTTYSGDFVGGPQGLTVTVLGGFDEMDNHGSMDVSWEKVSAANPTQPCTVASTVNGACVMQTELGAWDNGLRLGLQVNNSNKVPTTASPGHACGAQTPGTNKGTFTLKVSASGPHVTTNGNVSASYGF
jgi:hypothetical protein